MMRHALRCGTSVMLLVVAFSGVLHAQKPSPPRVSFSVLANTMAWLDANRVACHLNTSGFLCVGNSNMNGDRWPRETTNNHMFWSGLQFAAITGADGGPWSGDTTGGQFGARHTAWHGRGIGQLHDFTAAGAGEWPEAARVPTTGPGADLYTPRLRGRPVASEGDLWFLTWDGVPENESLYDRPHPLGLLVETRALQWNTPAWNQDILYFAFTFYNVTASAAAAYGMARPELRGTLEEYGRKFQELNEERFGVELPDGGYSFSSLYAGTYADPDVARYTDDRSSVNLPLEMGFSWGSFGPASGFNADAAVHAPPFYPAPGFFGVTALRAPGDTRPPLALFSTYQSYPASAAETYEQFAGVFTTLPCTYDPMTTRVCFIDSIPQDTDWLIGTPETSLGPGQARTMVVAYIFAAPVAVAGLPTLEVPPGDPLQLGDAALMADGVNLIDSIAGYAGFTDRNGDGVVDAGEMDYVPGSLYYKARLAQVFFESGFATPEAPQTPDFFLVPGDGRVTVLWRRSPSEETGDPYFALAANPRLSDESPNPLYDPNFREFDVEGYRIYRGRTDDPAAMEMVAQFDYQGTSLTDYAGLVRLPFGQRPNCAPELGMTSDCPVEFDPFVPGVARTVGFEHPLVRQVVQLREGDRVLSQVGSIITLRADTAGVGDKLLEDTGVPFSWVDESVRNDTRYYYAVTAFDINSYASGPSSFESPAAARAVVPSLRAVNRTADVSEPVVTLRGRGVTLTDTELPTINAASGTFNKPFPPAHEAFELELAALVTDVLEGDLSFTIRLDSIDLGSAATDARPVRPAVYHLTVESRAGPVPAQLAITQSYTSGGSVGSAALPAVRIDPDLAERFGGGAGYSLPARLQLLLAGSYYSSIQGRGCINHAQGFAPRDGFAATGCSYNGTRWFTGTNEAMAHPTGHNRRTSSFVTVEDNFGNAGELPGVTTIYEARSYNTAPFWWRIADAMLGGAVRASDIRVHWGAGGAVDSVVDITWNVPVSFDSTAGGGWGFLNEADQAVAGSGDQHPSHATIVDVVTCVPPFTELPANTEFLGGCGAAGAFYLSSTAVPGAVAFASGGTTAAPMNFGETSGAWLNLHPAAQDGFILYIAGRLYTFELEGGVLPAEGTVWTLRSYVGVINGGAGLAGFEGPYEYVLPASLQLPFTAVGAEIHVALEATNEVLPVTVAQLDDIHTVPDPFYLVSGFDGTAIDRRAIQFVNLPERAAIRIYTSSGVLVDVLEHVSEQMGGTAVWDLRSRNGKRSAPGVYFYHVESDGHQVVKRFTIVPE